MKKGFVRMVPFLLISIALVSLFPVVALGEAPVHWFEYILSEGMTVYQPGDPNVQPPPSGLGEMYRWAERDSGDALYFRMPAGRVLATASLTPMEAPMSARELQDLWPIIAQNLINYTWFVYDNGNNAQIVHWLDRQWLHLTTAVMLDGEDMVSIDLECYANCDDGNLLEIWLISPTHSTYRYDNVRAAELALGLNASQLWLDSVRLP